jgi:uncharacterized protein YdeI (YjbR/CyaY-like superfamily)
MEYKIQKLSNGMQGIALEPSLVKKLMTNDNKRVICKLNDTVLLHAAITYFKDHGHVVYIANKYLKQLNIKIGNTVKAVIKKDTSPLQFNIPEEFAEVINTDPDAKAVFDKLTDGNKRGLIALVNMVKSSDKKIERSLLIAKKIKAGITSPPKMLKPLL